MYWWTIKFCKFYPQTKYFKIIWNCLCYIYWTFKSYTWVTCNHPTQLIFFVESIEQRSTVKIHSTNRWIYWICKAKLADAIGNDKATNLNNSFKNILLYKYIVNRIIDHSFYWNKKQTLLVLELYMQLVVIYVLSEYVF